MAALPAFFTLFLGCDSPLMSKSCTLMDCGDRGVRVDFSFREKGTYVFELTVDGEKTRCEATLPLPPSPPAPCDRDDVFLTLSGSQLPPEQQSIGGILLPTTEDAKSLTLRATRDGRLLGEKTVEVTYRVTPGPNGPDCDPKECRGATITFPD